MGGISILLIGTLLVALLIAAMVMFMFTYQRKAIAHEIEKHELEEKFQRGLLSASIEMQEAERHRLGRELHDGINPVLSATKLILRGIQQQVHEPEALEMLRDSEASIAEAAEEMRRVSHNLAPVWLERNNLFAGLQEFFAKLQHSGMLHVQCSFSDGDERLSKERALYLYRVVQELTNNLLKHANATSLDIEGKVLGEQVTLQLRDNGRGFSNEAFRQLLRGAGGIGLKNLYSRVQLLNGTLQFQTLHPGTLVTVVAPID